MATLETALDPRAPSFLENRSSALAALALLEATHAQAREGGGEREVTRHHARGKLLPRERIELLVDRDTALLELAATTGEGVVTALGVVEGAECVIVANDPTVLELGLSDAGERKAHRAVEVANLYRLPLIFLWESSAEARQIAVTPNAPVLVAVFGNFDGPVSMADFNVAIRGHGNVDGADAAAEDERDALRMIRQMSKRLVFRFGLRAGKVAQPRYEVEDLLAVTRTEVREVLARLLDGSEFDEFRAHRGEGMVAGFGAVYGRRVAVLGNTESILDGEAVGKAVELTRLARAAGVPVVVLANPARANVSLARALAGPYQVNCMLSAEPPAWALTSRGFRFVWPSSAQPGEPYDGVIDPRATRTVLGICLSAMGDLS